MTITGSLQVSIPIVKIFFTRNFLSRQNLATNLRYGEKWDQNVKFGFRDPKIHIHAQNDVIRCIHRENRCRSCL